MKETKYILGIETSCDDTSMAIIQGGDQSAKILSHISFGQEESLKEWGGVVPEIAARNHLSKITPLLKQIFIKADITPHDIDLISVTTFPGLLGPLLTGLNAAKTLALLLKKPILPVNHLYAHLEAIHITDKITYPYLGLLISGGHSLYIWVKSKNDFKVLGGTIDDASGEAFDKGGKILGLGYPAGHIIDKLSKFGDPQRFEFPIGLKSSADCRLSFSGLKTSLRVFLEKNPEILNSKPNQFETKDTKCKDFYDLCASYQRAISKALLLKLRYAIKEIEAIENKKFQHPIVVGGGVAANSDIREQVRNKYSQAVFVDKKYCTDNGAMIANYGLLHLNDATPYPECLELDARSRYVDKGQTKNG